MKYRAQKKFNNRTYEERFSNEKKSHGIEIVTAEGHYIQLIEQQCGIDVPSHIYITPINKCCTYSISLDDLIKKLMGE